MRIIAGQAKGRRLKSPKRDSAIKPILGRIQQSLFDSLRPRIAGSHFLDLYAGTGIVGLEALSRGAQHVAFVEKGWEGIKLIKANIEIMKVQDKASVLQGDILGGALMRLKMTLASDFLFDIVFSAPPYLDKDRRGAVLIMSVPTLERLVESQLLADGAWVVLQHHKKEPTGPWPKEFQIFKESRFGESVLTYLEYKGQ